MMENRFPSSNPTHINFTTLINKPKASSSTRNATNDPMATDRFFSTQDDENLTEEMQLKQMQLISPPPEEVLRKPSVGFETFHCCRSSAMCSDLRPLPSANGRNPSRCQDPPPSLSHLHNCLRRHPTLSPASRAGIHAQKSPIPPPRLRSPRRDARWRPELHCSPGRSLSFSRRIPATQMRTLSCHCLFRQKRRNVGPRWERHDAAQHPFHLMSPRPISLLRRGKFSSIHLLLRPSVALVGRLDPRTRNRSRLSSNRKCRT